ncbi:MAG: glucose-6-phosphate dehydrogenase assembly protein OpcA, partial [Pseudonocardiaceae bacterium]
QIRVGGDAGASEVLVLRLYGPLADHGDSVVVPLLLSDCPVVVWWPGVAPAVPAQDPIGKLAQRRITDATAARQPIKELERRSASYTDGDTDLAWTRLTPWRALLAAALDLPPYEKVEAVTVTGAADNPSTDLLAGWLRSRLQVPVRRRTSGPGGGISSAVLERRCGPVELIRPDGKVGTLRQPGQPDRQVPLRRRPVRDCLAEELRRLNPDQIYQAALQALAEVDGRAGATHRRTVPAKGLGATLGESRGDR